MGSKEKELMNSTWREDNAKGRMFRANCGMAYIGKIIEKTKTIIKLLHYRYFHGMPEGFPDQVGWESRDVAAPCCGSCDNARDTSLRNYCELEEEDQYPDNCCDKYIPRNPKKLAIFKARETKTGKLKLSKEQQDFRDQLLKDGGIYEEKRE